MLIRISRKGISVVDLPYEREVSSSTHAKTALNSVKILLKYQICAYNGILKANILAYFVLFSCSDCATFSTAKRYDIMSQRTIIFSSLKDVLNFVRTVEK